MMYDSTAYDLTCVEQADVIIHLYTPLLLLAIDSDEEDPFSDAVQPPYAMAQ